MNGSLLCHAAHGMFSRAVFIKRLSHTKYGTFSQAFCKKAWACSLMAGRDVYTVEVVGSIPARPISLRFCFRGRGRGLAVRGLVAG